MAKKKQTPKEKAEKSFYRKLRNMAKTLNQDEISLVLRNHDTELRKSGLIKDESLIDKIVETILAKKDLKNDVLMIIILSPMSFSPSYRFEAGHKLLANIPTDVQLKQLIKEYKFVGTGIANDAKKMLEERQKSCGR